MISCLHCGYKLAYVYIHCPNCVQDNSDNRVSCKPPVGDFFNNYLGVDSRMGRSLRPFLRRPGKLTKDFAEGKRVSFMHPIRLYLVLSLFYFFIISLPDTPPEEPPEVPDKLWSASDSTASGEIGRG